MVRWSRALNDRATRTVAALEEWLAAIHVARASEALKRRHQTIRTALAEQHLDALVVTSLPNILYLTNFTGTSAIVILTADRVECLTDSRYVTEVGRLQREFPALELTKVDGAYDVTLVERLTCAGASRESASRRPT